jgi:GDP/UDP-N,N'-diacetylbacillosamine 2-epimerase (hydrolysing)
MLAVASAAMIHNIPIAHIHGGEKTEGVIDEAIRHSITKMSYLHFTTTSEYRDRVIQLGENPNRVYNFGALGVENILNEQLLSKEELEHLLQTRLNKPFVLVTYHPVTLEKQTLVEHMNSIFQVCKKFNNVKFIFTKSNADEGGRQINEMIDSFVSSNENTVSYKSLGMLKYLSALKYCDVVMGNSSSGIIEAPSFKIPTINIGDRQKGRLQSNSIINCEPEASEIVKALNKCMNITYRKSLRGTINPYGNGNTSIKISSVIKKFLFENDQDLKKNFYDIGICK